MANEPTPAPAGKSKKADVIIRVIVWGAVAVAVVLVFFQWRAKTGAADTYKAWSDAMREHNDQNRDVRKSALTSLIVGGPRVETAGSGSGSETVESYTWSGPFSSYTAKLRLEAAGEDPVVADITPPEQFDAAE